MTAAATNTMNAARSAARNALIAGRMDQDEIACNIAKAFDLDWLEAEDLVGEWADELADERETSSTR